MALTAPAISKSKYLAGVQCPKLLWHWYNAKDEIILAVAQLVLARLEVAVTVAEAAPSRSRARQRPGCWSRCSSDMAGERSG